MATIDSYTCVMVLKDTVTCQNLQKGVCNDRLQFTANNKRAVQTLKPSSAQKNTLREFLNFLSEFACINLPTSFPASSNHCMMHCCVFCNLADSFRLLASKKKNSGNHYLHSQK